VRGSRTRVATVRSRLPPPSRMLALGAAALVIGSFLGVLYHVVDVVSDPDAFLVIVALTLLVTTALAGRLSLRRAVLAAVVLFALGLGWYLRGLSGYDPSLWAHVRYTLAMVTGQSVLAIVALETWVLAVTPAPVFLTWYLAVRRRYVAGAAVGGATTLFFVLTGDAGAELTLLGTVGVIALVGVGELDRRGGSVTDADVVATVVALTILVSATVTLVPGGMGYTFSPDTGFENAAGEDAEVPETVEASLLGADAELSIRGSLDLSSSVRYRVSSTEPAYWRVGAYDLYTGDGWMRQGETGPLDRRLGTPVGRSRTVEQTYRPLAETRAMPARWRPARVEGAVTEATRVTSQGGLRPTRAIGPNETYTVESAVPAPTRADLRTAGRAYPDAIADRYTRLPDSTPARVTDRTRRLTENADTPYETARVIETWLENNRAYSLNVSRPSGNVADAFLFEMERGYCTYYATTMAVMLRSQDIPARMVVGYSTGQRVAEDEWVVRGHDAHAWVEVYFPEVGWVQFDPTPAGPRESARRSDLETARQNNAANVDTGDSQAGEWTPTTPSRTETPTGNTTDDTVTVDVSSIRGGQAGTNTTLTPDRPTTAEPVGGATGGDGSSPEPLTATRLLVALLAVLGIAGAARRTGLSRRAVRTLRMRFQRRTDPETDVERAFERLSAFLERHHRERRSGETVRAYLDAIGADERARRVAAIRERARYAGTVEAATAEEAVTLVDELVAE